MTLAEEVKNIGDTFKIVGEDDGFLFIPEIFWNANFSHWLRDLELQRGHTVNWAKIIELERGYRIDTNPEGNIAYTVNEIASKVGCSRDFLLRFLKRHYRLSGFKEETWERFSVPYKELFGGTQHLRLLSLPIHSLKYRETRLQGAIKSDKKRKITRGRNKGKLVDKWKIQNLGWHIVSKRDQP